MDFICYKSRKGRSKSKTSKRSVDIYNYAKNKGWGINDIINQVDNCFPKITYLDFLDVLNNKLKQIIKVE